MFGFKKKQKNQDIPPEEATLEPSADIKPLEEGLEKTRKGIFSGLKEIFSRSKSIEPEMLDDIEERLLIADVGIDATLRIMDALNSGIKKNRLNNSEDLFSLLNTIMADMLKPVHKPLVLEVENEKPALIMAIGVNGVGKTTTIGKLAKQILHEGHSVMLAAGDTFRAAAIEQLQVWGERNQVAVVSQAMGSDSAAVIYDALESARAKQIDVLIADTAGRLHTKSNLMEELKKVRRVINKFDAELQPEVLLVLDATTGQNALMQARQFHEAIGVSGIALTKLDGTAKGGIIFALANELGIPIRFIGIGEQVEDLREFEPASFVRALLKENI